MSNIRYPTESTKDLQASVLDIISTLDTQPRFEVRKIEFIAIASSSVMFDLSSLALTTLDGAMQIAATFTDHPFITYNNTKSITISYNFGAGTDGKQTATFLLIGR